MPLFFGFRCCSPSAPNAQKTSCVVHYHILLAFPWFAHRSLSLLSCIESFFIGNFLLSILITCPIHCGLCIFIYSEIEASLKSWYSLLLILVSYAPRTMFFLSSSLFVNIFVWSQSIVDISCSWSNNCLSLQPNIVLIFGFKEILFTMYHYNLQFCTCTLSVT